MPYHFFAKTIYNGVFFVRGFKKVGRREFMKIVLVVDQFDSSNNGTTVTARRYAEELRKRGHEVTILAGGT